MERSAAWARVSSCMSQAMASMPIEPRMLRATVVLSMLILEVSPLMETRVFGDV
jgi:hypothetical protein